MRPGAITKDETVAARETFMGRTIVPFRHSVKLVPQCRMSSVLKRTSARLLASTPNYLEVTAVMVLAVVSRFLFKPRFWSFNPKMCVSIALFAVIFIYACLDKGQILSYLGWVKPRRKIYWIYTIMAGAVGACAALFLLHSARIPVGSASPTQLLYGASVGPIIEEVIFRGATFSVIYVTACSSRLLAHWRIGLSIVVSSLLFVWCHTRAIGVPWIVIFLMGVAYALVRWRSNSTATSALMHATYNCVIAIAMIQGTGA
jgi:membrane protease YdiL (CAAX protease family)